MSTQPYTNMKIAIDLMGGGQSPSNILQAILETQRTLPGYHFVAIASPDAIAVLKDVSKNIDFCEAAEFIEMHETPLAAVRRKKQSSMAIGLQLLKTKQVDAFVSTGNTGALIASSMLAIPLMKGIDKPALLALLPSASHTMAVLDVGAHVHCNADLLVQFALLGIAYQNAQGVKLPRVGLLNIGQEEEKGREEVKKSYQILQKMAKNGSLPFTFMGNIEGREAFQGLVDVLITDGFSGNIFLKTSEGIASFLLDALEKKVQEKNIFNFDQTLQELHQKFNYAEYPGAILCGIEGLVIKCHGNSNLPALVNGIKGALRFVQAGLIDQMKISLQRGR